MDLDELFALMAAPIYAAWLNAHIADPGTKPTEVWNVERNQAMQLAVRDARMIWEIAQAQARDA